MAIKFQSGSYLVKNHIVSIALIGIYWLVVANITIYYLISRIDDKYFIYLYQKRDIDLSKVIKIIFYLFCFTFVLGIVFEIFTRGKVILYFGTWLFILSTLVIIWRSYKTENILPMIADAKLIDKKSIDALSYDYVFALKYVIIATIILSVSSLTFIFFLYWFR